jgi:ATP-dependent Clp protease protease subunit
LDAQFTVEMKIFRPIALMPAIAKLPRESPLSLEPALRRADEEPEEKDNEKSKSPELQSQVAQALFKSRTVLIFGEVDMKMAERVTAQLLAYNESEGDIRVIVNSPGGHVESGDTIHDMIRFVGPKVKMIGTGWVASAGAHIFLGAEKENRFCLPFTRFLLHQPLGGVRGQASDISIEAEEILKMRERLIREIAKQTGQPYERVVKDTDRNFWMGAEDAVKYGLVHRIVSAASEI